jgi:adenosylmethionine-8-amino-7-oxononanoate aminotransferase
VLLIHDEIITGFGRTGKLWGSETVGAWPDILSCGKGISGGYAPLAAIIVTEQVASAFWGEAADGVQFFSGHTFGGNPVACAVGEAAVRYLLDNDLVAKSNAVGDYLAAQLGELKSQFDVVDEVRGSGMMRGLAFKQPIGRPMYSACRNNGLLTRPAPDWIGIAPPLVTTTEEADEIVEIVAKSLGEVTA